MAIDYSGLLTPEQKKNLLEQRLTQFAAEAYQHELNKQVALSASDSDSVSKAEEALGILETAINVHKNELDALNTTAE